MTTPQASSTPATPVAARVKQIVDDISGLPTLPVVITQVTKLMQSPKVSANEVGNAISSDQALASKILKVVNSPFYGFPSRIKTITHAIVILGFNAVKATALSASVFSSFNKSGPTKQTFDRQAFWKHSLGVGAAARVLSKRMRIKETEEAFLAGLMHDIGKVVLDQYMHDSFEKALALVHTKQCVIGDAEKEVLNGFNHTDIGAALARKWHLNDELISVIQDHHTPSSASHYFQLTSIIHVANILIRALDIGNSGDPFIPKISDAAWRALNIPTDALPDLLQEIATEMEKAEVFFNMVS